MDYDFIDIHTHALRPGVTCVLSCSFGRDGMALPDAPFVSAGIHPWDAETVDIDSGLSFLSAAPVAAIGETGLDFSKPIDRKRQATLFETQLDIAEKRGLPVIIHCVKAYNEVLQMLKSHKLKAAIFHGYIGSPEQTVRIIEGGYYISIGYGSLGSPKTMASLNEVPLDRIFTETDTSEITIEEIYREVSKVKSVNMRTLRNVISTNFKTIFE